MTDTRRMRAKKGEEKENKKQETEFVCRYERSVMTSFLMAFAESRKLMADSANPKTLVSG